MITKEWLEARIEECRQQWLEHLKLSASYEGAMEALRLTLVEFEKVEEVKTEEEPTEEVVEEE